MIEVKNLNKTYDRRRAGENHVIRDISFTLPDTGFVCILGPSGCGKTSLLNAIGGLDSFDSGTIVAGDTTVNRYGTALFEAERNRSFGYIFQNYYLLPDHSVGYNVYLGLHSLKLTHAQKLRRVKQALKAVEMDRYIRRNVGELSGGQQQRVAIARALARKPRVIFADEPTGNLDETNTLNICGLLRKISKTSLVIMVTHEERIARFFADRIISLDAGRIRHDSDSWQRDGMEAGSTKAFYTGDYAETRLEADNVQLRILQQEGIAPVQISVLALQDRIVIKVDDERAVSCGPTPEPPALIEGKRPTVTLEELEADQPGQEFLSDREENVLSRAGGSIRFTDMVREALHMGHGKKLKTLGIKLFLILLTVLTALSVADYITLKTVRPEDFVVTHSQMLEVQLEKGPRTGSSTSSLQNMANEFKSYLSRTDVAHIYLPSINYDATIYGSPILQASQIGISLRDFSYAPLGWLEEEQLILGRMPEKADEVVVDRWVLDEILGEDGIAQNGIADISYFLDKQIRYASLTVSPTIVGICDSGEPAVYMGMDMFASLGTSGTEVVSLSNFQAMYPGEFDSVTLAENECIVLPHNAGETYWEENETFTTSSGVKYAIAAVCDKTDHYAKLVVADSQIDDLMLAMSRMKFSIYCQDKQAMTEYLQEVGDRLSNIVRVTVVDSYGDMLTAYTEASQQRADARVIIIATVILLSMVMLYLLRRSDVYSRIGMLSVYRLLGIPSGKAVGIFMIESVLSSLTTALPAALGTWLVLAVLRQFEVTGLLLSFGAALLVYVGIVCFQMLVTWLPTRSLLRLPPARLAAKYDF